MKIAKTSGAVLAATAAALLISGTAVAPESARAENKIKCFGVNSCKGTSACKTADNACKGKNGCNGHGFLYLTEHECAVKGGKVGQG